VAAWLGDTVDAVHRTYAHLMPDADERGRTAMDQFFKRAGAREVPWMCLQTVQFDAKSQARGVP